MDSFGSRLKYIRQKSGLSQQQLADKLRCTQQAIQRAEAGQSRQPRFAHDASTLFNVTYDWLVYGREADSNFSQSQSAFSVRAPHSAQEKTPSGGGERDLPVLGEAVGGENGRYILTGDVAEYILRPPQLQGVKNAYALYIHGTTMSPRYIPGEIVYVHPGKPLKEGDFVCVQIKGKDEDALPEVDIFQLTAKDHTGVCLLKLNSSDEIIMHNSDLASIDKIIMSSQT